MPFGLTNAPTTFQRFMNDVFHLNSFVFLDDLLIFLISPEEHMSHIHSVLQHLHNNNIHVNLSKTFFHHNSIEYLGFIVSPLRTSPTDSPICLDPFLPSSF